MRVIDAEGEQAGVMSLTAAIALAKEGGLDLVEVSPNAAPPVCRIMDFGKHLFELNKKAQSAKRKQKQVHVKEIKFRPGTDEGDYQIKLRKLTEFLEYGDKAKITLERILGSNTVDNVQSDLIFDQTGSNGTHITWFSSDENFVSSAGHVVRPDYDSVDQLITIKATVTKN